METKYYDSTNLFSPRIKTDRSPDFRGDVELSAELCAYIMNKVKRERRQRFLYPCGPRKGAAARTTTARSAKVGSRMKPRKHRRLR